MVSLAERFWKYVTQGPQDECWDWHGAIHPEGYGRLAVAKGRFVYVHRVAWELHYGKIPSGKLCLHRYDRRRCVNPNHLFLGTNAENSADMVAKGRQRPGELHGTAKLVQAQVDDIRQRHAAGETARTIAIDYGLSLCHTQAIIARRYWRNTK